jgi:hypothetical protein
MKGEKMDVRKTYYLDKASPSNVDQVITAVKERLEDADFSHVVIASVSGESALKFQKALTGSNLKLISVTEHAGFLEKPMGEEKKRELEDKGIKVVVCTHALNGVERAIKDAFGGLSRTDVVGQTLALFCQGVKVAVESALMAADTNSIPTDKDIIAVAGTENNGVDTAIVMKPANTNKFFDLKIREILIMPKQ